jgi:hypothetical protein
MEVFVYWSVMTNQQHFAFRSVLKQLAIAALLLTGLWSFAEESGPSRVVVPLSDPTRPAMVKAHLLNGSITVKGYDGKEVIVETRGKEHERESPEPAEGARGLRRIDSPLSIDAENNEVNIKLDVFHQDADCIITVPRRSSLSLSTVNGSSINVSDVEGELDVKNINGAVTLNHVAGSVVAHALNGRVLATFTRVDPQKPMAFSSMNGDIDVTLPADVKANLTLRTDNGGIYSDFDIPFTGSRTILEENKGTGGKYRLKTDKTVHATLNGGGQEIQIKNFNGNIYLRKAGK